MNNGYSRRIIRANKQWVQITRDGKDRMFIFAFGDENEFRAYEMTTCEFKYIANWKEALEWANKKINN
jgi:hypothetical protein